LQTQSEECQELSIQCQNLNEKVDEDESAYQTLVKEIEDLTNDFETIDSDRSKALSEVGILTRKNKDLEQKLLQKCEEIKILKSQHGNVKKVFDGKITQIKRQFNNKLVEYGKLIYPDMVDKQSVIFEDSFVHSKRSNRNESNMLESVLRMSHLANSKVGNQKNLSMLQNLENIENIDDVLAVHNKLVDQIVHLFQENRVLQMKVIRSDAQLNEDILSTHLAQQVENLNKHLQYYRSQHYDHGCKEEYVVLGINQHKEAQTYKLHRELASKCKKIDTLEKRISQLEMLEKSSKIQSYQDKISTDENIQQEVEVQTENLEQYVKTQLVGLLSN